MISETQTYDPDGDVHLILMKEPYDILAEPVKTKEAAEVPKPEASGPTANDSEGLEEIRMMVSALSSTATENATDVSKPEVSGTVTNEVEEIRMVVSSSHLSLSSLVFRAMLRRNFAEAESLRNQGSVTISLPDDDVYAFSLIMNIIHLRNNSLPREVTLSTLTSFAILVDKYGFHEAVTTWVESWLAKLHKKPTSYNFGKEVICWICLSWVFGLSKEFAEATKIAAWGITSAGLYGGADHGGTDMQRLSECLPTPGAITARLEETRRKAIKVIIDQLKLMITKLMTPTGLCTIGDPDCNGLMLGTLTRSASQKGLWPLDGDYQPSFNTLFWTVQSLRIKSLCGLPQKLADGKAKGNESNKPMFPPPQKSNLFGPPRTTNPFEIGQPTQSFSFPQQTQIFGQQTQPLFPKPHILESQSHDVAASLISVSRATEQWLEFARGLNLKEFEVQR